MKKIIPILLFLVGSGAGVGAGIFLQPDVVEEDSISETKEPHAESHNGTTETNGDRPSVEGYEYVRLTNQFVIPIIRTEKVASMVVISLSLEVAQGYADRVLQYEPKIRDEFLRAMFDYANIGGFDGEFTRVDNLNKLQTALLEVAQKSIGSDIVSDVLIFEIARQDY